MKPVKNKIILESVEITDASSEGKAVAKVSDGMIVFVENAVPGDVADIEIFRKKKSYAEGKAINIIKESKLRQQPFCEHFGTCGGCKWQNMKYESQLFYKQKQVADALQRLGKIDLSPNPSPNGEENLIVPIIASEKTTYYRNKLEFTFSNKRWLTKDEVQNPLREASEENIALGFHIPQRFDKVLDINHCHLQKEPSNEIRLEIKKYAVENNLSFFDLRTQEGFLRNLIIRTSTTNDLMVIVAFHHEDKTARENLLQHIAGKFPQITSLLYIINPKRNDTIFDLEVHIFKGKDYILEEMEGLKFKIGTKSFYQTNSEQAYELYKVARELADLKGNEIVYDLYTGTGTIANFIARKSKKVIGIEHIPEAIENAKENSKINNIDNTSFFSGDIKETLTNAFIQENGKPNVIITDPPRVGMHEDVVKKLLEIEAEKIVYISCNPSTQARDLQILDTKYKVMKVQPVDMFPHTHHVENVVLLVKKV